MVNYIGPSDGQGIRIYYDGVQAGSHNTKYAQTSQSGAGRVVLGRQGIDWDATYGSFGIDELLFFNETLTDENIQAMN